MVYQEYRVGLLEVEVEEVEAWETFQSARPWPFLRFTAAIGEMVK